MTDYGLHLLPQHRAMLAASAITPEVAGQRGYFSVHTKADLERKGFARPQRTVPGLLIPVHATDGTVRLYQYRPDSPRTAKGGKEIKYETPYRAAICLDVPPAARPGLADPAVQLWITEGARKADAAVSAGLCCLSLFGVDGWQRQGVALPDWSDVLIRDREVVVCFDSDVMTKPSVAAALARLTGWLEYRGAKVRHATLPDGKDGSKTGLDDYLAAGRTAADLTALVHVPRVKQETLKGDPNTSGKPPEKPLPDVPPMTIAQVEGVYAGWLHDGDKVTTRVVHAVYVANMVLDGDPVWMMLVGGSGQGKTERIAPLAIMPHVELASTLSGDAALLSATSRKDRAEHAHGGLLRRIGDKGILVIKDFTSILEMDRTARGMVLAALREVYDGRWDREVGTDGGQTLTWKGKCGLLAGTTAAIDRAHSVMNDMGPRSLFLRLPPANLDKVAASALDHMGRETTMRAELAAATAGLLTHLPGRAHESSEARDGLIGLASIVSQARSPVHRDFKGEIELVGDAEAPTRIIKQLGQIWRACGVLGLDHADSWEVVRRCALDSIPKLRGAVIRYLDKLDAPADTTMVGTGVVHPTRTVRRALEDLAAHGVVNRETAGPGRPDRWELSDRAKGWIKASGTLPEMLESQPKCCTVCGDPLSQEYIDAGFTDHGEAQS